MELIVNRFDSTYSRTIGRLFIGDDQHGQQYCYTLERAADDPRHPRIPAGRYRLSTYQSPHFHHEVILLHDVPGRSMIEIHIGNTEADSTGCILVGLIRLQDTILESRAAFGPLLAQVKAAIAREEACFITVNDLAAALVLIPKTA